LASQPANMKLMQQKKPQLKQTIAGVNALVV
jgi:hypothetical protein